MNKTYDSLESKIRQSKTMGCRLRHKPMSPSELTLTTVLSVLVGVGVSILAAINVPQNNHNSQVQLETTEQFIELFSTDSSSELFA